MIRFPCPSCDKRLSIREEMAGRVARCPHCQNTVRVPQPDAADDEAVEKAEGITPQTPPRRKSSDAPQPPEAVRGGRPPRPREPVEDDVEELDEVPEGAEELDEVEEVDIEDRPKPSRGVRRLDREEDDEPRRRKRSKKVRAKGESWYVGFWSSLEPFDRGAVAVMAVTLALAILSILLPPVAYLGLLLCLAIFVVGQLSLIVAAFQEGAGVGCAFLIVPFFPLYFLIVHFDACKRGLLLLLAGVVLLVVTAIGHAIGAGLWSVLLPFVHVPRWW